MKPNPLPTCMLRPCRQANLIRQTTRLYLLTIEQCRRHAYTCWPSSNADDERNALFADSVSFLHQVLVISIQFLGFIIIVPSWQLLYCIWAYSLSAWLEINCFVTSVCFTRIVITLCALKYVIRWQVYFANRHVCMLRLGKIKKGFMVKT